MEDTIRCPMCSKLNPADLDVCQFCQARLKPLVDAGQTSQPDQPSKDNPDWLDSFRSDEQNGERDLPQAEGAQEGDIPDWLSRIRERSQSEETPEPGAQTGIPDLPDWLNDEPEDLPTLENQAVENRLDIEDLRRDSSAPQEEDVSIDTWLENLRDETPGVPGSVFTAQEQGEQKEDAQEEQALDWWSQEPAGLEPEAEKSDNDLVDRVGVFSTEDLDPLANWSAVKPAETEAGDLEGEAQSALPAEEFPDWLSDLPGRQPEEFPTAEPATGQTGGFSWPGFGSQTPLPPAPDAAQANSEPEPAEETGPKPQDAETTTPEWLQAYSGPENDEEEKTPTWLSSLDQPQDTRNAFDEIPTQRIQPVKAQSGEDGEPSPPDWLSTLGSGGGANFPPPASTPFLEDAPEIPMNNLSADPFVMSDLPDWLSSLGPAGKGSGDEASGTSGPMEFEGNEISPAELPSWVRAMRPIESITSEAGVPQESDQRMERTGPLAGIRGVLPVEPSVSEYRKPPLYSIKLHTSDSQARYSEILEELLTNETAPIQPRPERLISSQRIFRVIIGLLLIAAVVAGALFRIFPAPSQSGGEVAAFKASIDSVTPGAPVLIVMEYEPALAGEMEASAAGVLRHLADQGAPLVFTSTLPTGQAMTVHLLEGLSGGAGSVEPQTFQLGYLAGGPAGIYNFLNYPRVSAPYWDTQSPILQGVNEVSGFQRVILITDTLETGQNWFEQWAAAEVSQPALSQVPLLLVSSAQAAPILRPYLDSHQADGMISGIQGGATYEAMRQQPSLASRNWNGYVGGLAVAFLIILLGGIINVILGSFSRRTSKDEA